MSPDVTPTGSEKVSPSYNLLFIAETNYTPGLATKCPADLGRFHRARAEAHQVIRAAKNVWFQDKVQKVMRGRLVEKHASKLCSMEEEV